MLLGTSSPTSLSDTSACEGEEGRWQGRDHGSDRAGPCHDRDTEKPRGLHRAIPAHEAGAQASLPITAARSPLPVVHTGRGLLAHARVLGLGLCGSPQLHPKPPGSHVWGCWVTGHTNRTGWEPGCVQVGGSRPALCWQVLVLKAWCVRSQTPTSPASACDSCLGSLICPVAGQWEYCQLTLGAAGLRFFPLKKKKLI